MIAGLSFVGLLLVGVPIAFSLALMAMLYIWLSGNVIMFESYAQQFYGGLENYGLLSLPLFILLGEFMNAGGIGRRLMAFALALIGSVRGGLAYVNLMANMMMASILGSTVAQITVMSKLAVPEMEKAGYPKDVSVAITAAGGMLAPIIPPSMLFIIFGVIAQVPIGDLFIAGIIPGVLLFLAFLAVIGWLGRRHGFPANQTLTLRERALALWRALPAVMVPVVIVGSIFGGIATPTEAAVIASVVAVVIGLFVYKEMRFADIFPAFISAARSSALVLFLIAAASLFSWVITFENLPAKVTSAMLELTSSPIMFLILVNLLLIFLGMVTDAIPAIILTVPVLLPVAMNSYGIDPVQFGVIVCLNLTMGLLTPPVGTGLFCAAALNNIRAERLTILLIPFFVMTLVVLGMLVLFPALSLGLVEVLK